MFPLKPKQSGSAFKQKGKTNEGHTSKSKYVTGDYYGRAMKNPMGRIRDVSTPGIKPVSTKKLGKSPRSFA